MQVRGAPLIGAVAAYGIALAMREDAADTSLAAATESLMGTRPTAVNLRWALIRMRERLDRLAPGQREEAAWNEADSIAEEDIELNRAIGQHGLELIRKLAQAGNTVNVLTHCNAGWLATVDYGTALAPIYLAHDEGIALHVWVDETRPRSQGFLTAWELGSHGVPYTVIADNAGGHLMQKGEVDMVIVGADRVTADGHVCNKIGTYLKALAASHNSVPFYAAVPSPTIDWDIADAMNEIPIELRSAEEIRLVSGKDNAGGLSSVTVGPEGMPVANPGFDVTPPALVTGIITEAGVVGASREGLSSIRRARS